MLLIYWLVHFFKCLADSGSVSGALFPHVLSFMLALQ